MIKNYESKRTIEEVLDIENGEIVNSKDFFKRSESEIFLYRRRLQEAIDGYSKPKFVCFYCNQLLRLSGKVTQRGKVLFFSHLHDSEECEIKTDNEESLTKEQIEALKFSKIRESERHKNLKKKIFEFLTDTSSISQGISKVEIEKRVTSNQPYFNWRQPDISFEYKGKRIVIELQLSTTFLSVIIERDIFYKMNEIFIIWIFNFSKNQQYVNLGNMMCKDIYYSNKRNAFILDEEAVNFSIEKKELILKCIWFEPKISSGVIDVNKSLRREKFVCLSELTFDDDNYKPYFIDADKLFETHIPSGFIKRNLEEELIKRRLTEQIFKNDIVLTPFCNLEKWGFVNESKIEVVPANYSEVLPFRYGVSWVRKTYWGAINAFGRKVVNFQYRSIHKVDYKDYIIAESKNKKYGLLTYEGYIIAPFEYSTISNFENGQAKAKKESGWGLIDENGYSITQNKTQISENVVKGSQFQLWGLENDQGDNILPFEYSEIEEFIDGKAKALKNNHSGVIDIKGRVITENKINLTDDIVKGSKFGLWGLETKDGEILLPFYYSQIGKFFDEKVYANKVEFWGVVDIQGNIIIPFEYSEISDFYENKAIARKDGHLGIIDIQGNIIVPFEFWQISDFINNKAKVKIGNLEGVIDIQGNIIVPIEYDWILEFANGKANARKNGCYGVIDEKGEILIPFQYDYSLKFANGKANARINGSCGVINEKGETLIPFKYKEIDDFVDGTAKASDWEYSGVINEKGETLIPFKYNEIGNFVDGKAKARIKKLWGVIDSKGETLLPFEYDEIGSFVEGKSKASKKGLWGIIDEKWETVIPFEYNEICDFVDGRAKAKKRDLWGVINEKWEILIPFAYSGIYLVNNMFMLVSNGILSQHICLGLKEEIITFYIAKKTDFGILFHNNLNNLIGLLHTSEIERSKQNQYGFDPRKAYNLYIKSFDVSKNRVSLSVLPNILSQKNTPVDDQKYNNVRVGDIVNGRVSGIKEFGVFVTIIENKSGLIHWTELKKHGKKTSDFVFGSQIDVIIIAIDEATNKITLTCKK